MRASDFHFLKPWKEDWLLNQEASGKNNNKTYVKIIFFWFSQYINHYEFFRLLEAQIATGGLIDPQAGHRVPIQVAFDRGLFDSRMNQILEDPSDDTKVNFFIWSYFVNFKKSSLRAFSIQILVKIYHTSNFWTEQFTTLRPICNFFYWHQMVTPWKIDHFDVRRKINLTNLYQALNITIKYWLYEVIRFHF